MRELTPWLRVLLSCWLLLVAPVRAQDMAELQQRVANMRYVTGSTVLPNAQARMEVPEGWRFLALTEVAGLYDLDSDDVREVEFLGWLLPGQVTLEEATWSVEVYRTDDGYIGEDPQRLDPYRMSWRMRDVYRWASNRDGSGGTEFEFVNFARAPVYDRNQHLVVWSERIRYPEDEGKELLDIYGFALSRRGAVGVEAEYIPSEWQDQVESAVELLTRSIRFDVGERYEDYSSTDDVADYELSHLITAESWIGPQTWTAWLTQPVDLKVPMFKKKLRMDIPNWLFWGMVSALFGFFVVRWIKGGQRPPPKFKPRGTRR